MTHTRGWTGRVFIGASLDGFIARPDGDIGWLTDPAPVPHRATATNSAEALSWDSFFPMIDHLVMGRGTYEKVLTFGAWPYAHKRVIVLSTTLRADDDRITVVRDLDEAITALDRFGARQVYVDGGKVIQTFLRADLIDEISIGWAPVLLGHGLPLFGFLDHDVQLRLLSSTTSGNGMVNATYAVHR
ncbi:dihydrofolate reductase family protein [Sinomonas mesophila]|uniref:dihydrofolate reductase family protein n=1 Tax=Sinomonas mesophila TaxID=1531955 RepID=UPI0009852C32|nr:dihydrofolate reductase family protein [Sinomonas mesophila]